MKLDHISLDQLKLSTLNVRKRGGKDVSDLLPSIRSLGILQPLLVRPNCEGFDIVAGQRRFHALTRLAEEGIADPVPCIIMEAGDDATAIEASLVENIARLPMDEIDQYKAFAALIAKGMDASGIAAHFGVTERLVSQRLAIANLIEPILNAYRREEISADTLRTLTMATPRRQKAWWALFKSKDEYAPTGRLLKEWLFGGSQVPVSNALFDLSEYKEAIVSDLFGDERYFADVEAFWPLQNTAVVRAKDRYLANGWRDIIVMEVGGQFATWKHEKTPKSKGGKVFITMTGDGEVGFHEGYLTLQDARRRDETQAKGDVEPKTQRSELTKAMQNYLGLHKHAAVRTELLARPSIALRLAVAHMIAGSALWSVRADEQRADSHTIRNSLASSPATTAFAQEGEAVRKLLGIESDDGNTIVPRRDGYCGLRDSAAVFESLMHMEDAAVLRVLAYAMAETLEAQSGTVEALGVLFSTDMRQWWQPDETFFDLLRDKQAINAIVREVVSDMTADAHSASTAKVQKKIIADCLSGIRERQIEDWLPRYMAFPASGYTGRFLGQVSFTDREADIDQAEDDRDDAS